MAQVLVYAERVADRLTSATLECTSGGASLADDVTVFLAGSPTDEEVAALGDHGATAVVVVEVPDDALVAPAVAAAVTARLAAGDPLAVLLPGTCDGRDVAAAVSVAADRPVLANVIGVQAGADGLVAEHAVFGGTTRVSARVTDAGAGLYLLRPGAFAPTPGRGLRPEVSTSATDPGEAGRRARVVERRTEAVDGPSLEEAPVVVTGGRGLGGPERFTGIVELARLLGGAPGATRAIVDAGWAPYGCQVGQTGKAVKPDVYLAFGVSGATQHLVGMRSARNVVAVNTDEQAPIFSVADLAVVGDAPAILDRLLGVLRARA